MRCARPLAGMQAFHARKPGRQITLRQSSIGTLSPSYFTDSPVGQLVVGSVNAATPPPQACHLPPADDLVQNSLCCTGEPLAGAEWQVGDPVKSNLVPQKFLVAAVK